MTDRIDLHLCECGCGQPTGVAPQTVQSRGIVKGQPLRFLRFHNLKLPTTPTGERHPQWVGDDVSYSALHAWVRLHKEKTGVCSTCGREMPTQWANISGLYFRDLNDYAEMCKECHAEFDTSPRWWWL